MSAIVYRFRVSFEDFDDVERQIEIRAGQSFLDLHNAIQQAIGFDNSKPASFYISGDSWRMGKEISSEEGRGDALMKDSQLNQFVNDPHQRFIYITDFDANWTLRVQLIKISRSDESDLPKLVRSVGESPKQYKPVHIADQSEFDDMVNEMVVGMDSEEIDEDGFDMDDDDNEDEDEGFVEEDEL